MCVQGGGGAELSVPVVAGRTNEEDSEGVRSAEGAGTTYSRIVTSGFLTGFRSHFR